MCKFHFISQMKLLRTLELVFRTKVNVWIEAPGWSPPHLLPAHSRSCLSSAPASRAWNALVFPRSQIPLAAVGFYELLENTSLSSQLRTCKQYIFLLSFRNVSSVHLCLSTNPGTAGTALLAALPVLWLCTRYSSVTEALLWLPRHKFWPQHKMTAMIIKGTAIWKITQYLVWRIVQYTWS